MGDVNWVRRILQVGGTGSPGALHAGVDLVVLRHFRVPMSQGTDDGIY